MQGCIAVFENNWLRRFNKLKTNVAITFALAGNFKPISYPT